MANGRGDLPCLDQDKADAWDEGYNAAVMQKYGIGPNPRNPYYDYTKLDQQAEPRADHDFVPDLSRPGGRCVHCGYGYGEGNHD